MRTNVRRTIRAAACVLFVAACTLLGAPSTWADDRYQIATDPNHPPFAYVNSSDRLTGFDVDLLNAVANDQNFEVTIRQMPLDEALNAAQGGLIDGVMAGVLITPLRERDFTVSDAYFAFGTQMAVPEGSTNIWSYDDLAGTRVAVISDSPAEDFAESIRDTYDFLIVPVPDAESMYEQVRNGNAQAAFDDTAAVHFAIAGGNGFMTVTPAENDGGGAGLLLRKQIDPELVDRFNAGLANLQQSGMYDKLLTRYLGDRQVVEPPSAAADSGSDSGLLGAVASYLWIPILLAVVAGVAVTFRQIARGIRAAQTPQAIYPPPPPPLPPPFVQDAPPAPVPDGLPSDFDAPPSDLGDPEARIRQLEQNRGAHEL